MEAHLTNQAAGNVRNNYPEMLLQYLAAILCLNTTARGCELNGGMTQAMTQTVRL
jgi:hypothetical protein